MGEEVLRHLTQIEAALPKAVWTSLTRDVPAAHAAAFYTGETPEWAFVVSSFDISEQGFPEGTRGYDGAARSKSSPLIVRLTRQLAERAVRLAGEV